MRAKMYLTRNDEHYPLPLWNFCNSDLMMRYKRGYRGGANLAILWAVFLCILRFVNICNEEMHVLIFSMKVTARLFPFVCISKVNKWLNIISFIFMDACFTVNSISVLKIIGMHLSFNLINVCMMKPINVYKTFTRTMAANTTKHDNRLLTCGLVNHIHCT